jgi:hypothetical protein
MTNHVFGYIYRQKPLAVMNRECKSDKLRHDNRAPGPSLYHLSAGRLTFINFAK